MDKAIWHGNQGRAAEEAPPWRAEAPPSEPPAQLSSQLHTSSALTSAASERPKLQRKRTSMTEKAFSLTRGGSMTSLETFTTGWLQRLLVRLVSNIFFEKLSMVMLCANAVVIGVQPPGEPFFSLSGLLFWGASGGSERHRNGSFRAICEAFWP